MSSNSSLSRTDCRKFAPNIFNKSKCTNCFRQKEEHSAEALESNRASRKVTKCGYLFVAPGWDFSDPLNRTKRWQRRWFVLYDDGELNYSVDEHPDTVPQAVIDMNQVLEVTGAEDVTGHPYSFAITAPDRVHFVKSSCREEARWWTDVLTVFTRSKGRHKRNATFPGGQSTTILQGPTATMRSGTPNPIRPRYNSCHTEPITKPNIQLNNPKWNSNINESNSVIIKQDNKQDSIPTRDGTRRSPPTSETTQTKEIETCSPLIETRTVYKDQPPSSASPPTRDKINTEEKARFRQRNSHHNQLSHQTDYNNKHHNHNHNIQAQIIVPPSLPPSDSQNTLTTTNNTTTTPTTIKPPINSNTLLTRNNTTVPVLDDFTTNWRKIIPETAHKDEISHRMLMDEYEQQTKRDEKLKDIAAVLTRPRIRRLTPSPILPSAMANASQRPTRDDDTAAEKDNRNNKLMANDFSSQPSSSVDVVDTAAEKLFRNDSSDVYNGFIDLSTHHRYSPSTELRVDLPAEDLLHMKKGWLSKQAHDQQWNRHWFVLKGAALTYYRDPNAEDRGIMDGVIDLNGVTSIFEITVARNFGFQLTLWDESRILLTAVTSGIRNNWITVLRRAAGLPEISENTSDTSPTSAEKEPIVPATPLTPRSILFSSDEEYRTASEGGGGGGGRRESGEWCEPLPPSPPLNRTPISRVKERARSRSSSGSRICKRSRSSPPSSRRSTIDSVRTDDLMLPCCEEPAETDHTLVEMLESEVRELRERLENSHPNTGENNLINKVQQQASEIEDLKSKLTSALEEISNTEKEVNRLRKIKQEAVNREKRMEELLTTLENTEKQLNERVEDMEMLKQMYGQDKDLWEKKLTDNEALLREAAERCELLSNEVNTGRRTIEQLQQELSKLSERLSRGIDENETLYKRIRELESGNSNLKFSKDKGRSVDSLSDLTNIDLDLNLQKFTKERVIEEYQDLRSRFEKAIQEIRIMKRELRESHMMYDELELTNLKLRQDMNIQADNDKAQLNLMAQRIQDLTTKLTTSEKQVRSLKQKLQDSREKRRSLSLKGRESFSIGKEVEEKLSELETKINALESNKVVKPHVRALSKRSTKREGSVDRQSPTEERKLRRMQARLRRKSLDSATSSEPMKILIRLNSLESKVSSVSDIQNIDEQIGTSNESISQPEGNTSDNELSTSTSASAPASDRLQTLENVVLSAREKVNECLCQVSLLKSSRSKRSSSPLSDRRSNDGYRSIEKCLTELGQLLKDNSTISNSDSSSSLSCSMSTTEIAAISDAVRSVVKTLETALRTKLLDIANRRMELRRNNQLTDKINLQLLAEKLAYESVIIERIHEALNTTISSEKTLGSRILKSELLETSHLIANLKRKISGKCLKRAYSSKMSLESLTKVLANKLLKSGHVLSQNSIENKSSTLISSSQTSQKTPDITDKMLEFLITKRDEINIALTKYKNTKMEQLANSLASETLSYVAESAMNTATPRANSFNEKRIREAWQLAQETVNNELIQSEISHVMMRCAQMYESTISPESNVYFSFYASERANLELWIREVETRLRTEMDENIKELGKLYESSLQKLKQQNGGQQWRHHVEQERTMNESRKLLAEFADITAHKALVDARISVLSKDYKPNDLMKTGFSPEESVIESLMEDDNYISKLNDADIQLKTSTVFDAEFQFLFQHYTKECKSILNMKNESNPTKDKTYVRNIADHLSLIEKEISKLEKHLNLKTIENNPTEPIENSDSTDWTSICNKCSKLYQRLVDLTANLLQKQSCQKCEELQNTIHRLGVEHEEKVQTLQKQQEKNMEELRNALENERASQAQLRERARKLERRLGTLDSEYSQQVESLRAAYNKTLTTAGLDRSLQGEENIRQRYQAEIEQLRALCEKGLVAMENSHRRVISELEDKHRREREQLRLEKEAALAEETQATLAALDAMRKAHEAEVQREVAKFKAEFVKKMQANPSDHDFGSSFYRENDEEMEEIKQEILSLSEKYSVKCVESAALEEELQRVTSQLAQAQQHIMQLDARNKQLRAHLMSEVAELDTNSLICGRDRTEISRQQSQKSSIRGDVTVAVAVNTEGGGANTRGGQRLSWKSISPGTGVSTVTSIPTNGGGRSVQEQRTGPCRNSFVAEPSALSIAELIRSPTKKSCQVTTTCRQPISPCPLAGMVAERKKRFELQS